MTTTTLTPNTYEAHVAENPDCPMPRIAWERNETTNEYEATFVLADLASKHLRDALNMLTDIASLTRVDIFGASLQDSIEQITDIRAMLDEAVEKAGFTI